VVTAEDVENAAALVNCSLQCWLSLLETQPEAEVQTYAGQLLRWLRKQPGAQSNETAMLRVGPKPRSASLRDAALGFLEGSRLVTGRGGKTWAAK